MEPSMTDIISNLCEIDAAMGTLGSREDVSEVPLVQGLNLTTTASMSRSDGDLDSMFWDLLPDLESMSSWKTCTDTERKPTPQSSTPASARSYKGTSPSVHKSVSQRKKWELQKKRSSSKNKVPSRYCHVCSRPAWRARSVGCSELKNGCCKIICEPCLETTLGVTFEEASTTGTRCTHCSNQCPPSARCHSYQRANNNRRALTILRRELETA
uniref:Zinc-finger domain-containing protein n=1 Tax=Erythrolobus madagascarensis TaxID=708628 RepID=A0A7S0XJY0_9RHOD|mmetsp:Transcript_82/g.138  ORF Transcript_82/g.138 Transcript_82/m.138 type:complete len:213 (+) Transcript_82:88-726(+)